MKDSEKIELIKKVFYEMEHGDINGFEVDSIDALMKIEDIIMG